ncbi:MAG: ribonuclease H family protein [Promethearchaeota archaeon]
MSLRIFTDGACAGNQREYNTGGWGVIILKENFQEPYKTLSGCKKNTTNNKMELTACIQGLAFIKEKMLKSTDFVEIHTDSAYISNCFNQKWHINWEKNGWKTSKNKPVKNKELWKNLLDLYRKIPYVTFKHVRAHRGNEFNEMVDRLAVEAIENCK